jgi:N-methylhydantoinase B
MEAVRAMFPDPVPGDVYIFNDPYDGGTHTPDVKIIRPMFHEGHLVAFGVSCGHWPDVGGPAPGTFNPQATESYAEGIIVPPTKLYDAGRRVESTVALLRANIRQPDERMGDLHGQVQATLAMEVRMSEFVVEYGIEAVEEAMALSIDRSRRLMQHAISELPDGEYAFTDYGDMDFMHPDRPLIKVHAVLTIDGDRASIDFSESDRQPIGVFGFARPALLAAVYDGTLHCFPELKPQNHGIISAIEVIATPGSCVDVLRPTPVTGYAAGAYEKVCAITMACWAQAFADIDPKRQHAATVNLANLVVSGRHPESGDDSVCYLWNEGGQGSRSHKDGNSFQLMIFGAGATNQPVEVLERILPIRYTKCEAVPDSCGHGRFRGGCGMDRSFEAVEDIIVTMHGDRAEVTPFGLGGGWNGAANRLVQNPGTPDEVSLGMDTVSLRAPAGTKFLFTSNGGGGFGPPHERDVERVLQDIRAEFITPAVAEEVYGVVLDGAGTVDEERTTAGRGELAAREPNFGLGPNSVHPVGASVRL